MQKATLKCFADESKVLLEESPSASLFNFPKQFTPKSKSKVSASTPKGRGSPTSSKKGTPSKGDSKKKSPSVASSRYTGSLRLSTPKLTPNPKSKVEETPKRKRSESQGSWTDKDTPLKNSASKKKPLPSLRRMSPSDIKTERSSESASELDVHKGRVLLNADAYVKRWNDLKWNERYTGVFESSVTALGDEVVQVFRRFRPRASAPPKTNRMKLLSGTVLEGSVWLRVSDDVKKARFSYPKRTVIQPYDAFCVPQGKHYSIEAGCEETIILFKNVTD